MSDSISEAQSLSMANSPAHATLQDVAALAGVSAKTVSRVVNKQGEIKEATRQRVQEAIDKLGYQPNFLARSLVHRRTHTLAVVAWGIDYFGPSRTIVGIEQKAGELGYSLFLNLLSNPDNPPSHEQVLSDFVKLVVVQAPLVATKARAGQFVIVRIDEAGERIPLTIADSSPSEGTITLIFQEVGKSTMQMGLLEVGDGFENVVGPLGRPTEVKNYGKVVLVGGGVGVAPLFPIARALKEAGNTVISIIGDRTKAL